MCCYVVSDVMVSVKVQPDRYISLPLMKIRTKEIYNLNLTVTL